MIQSNNLIDLEGRFKLTNHIVDGFVFIITAGKPKHESHEERTLALSKSFDIDVKGNGASQSFKQYWRADFGYGIYLPVWSYFHRRVILVDQVLDDETVDAVVIELSVRLKEDDDDYDKLCCEPDSSDKTIRYFSQLVPMRHIEYQSYDYDHEELVREQYYSNFAIFSRDIGNGKVFIAPTLRRQKDVLLLNQCFLSNCCSPLTYHTELERNGYWLDVEKEKHILEYF